MMNVTTTIMTEFHSEMNFRELGGYSCRDGRTVKHGLFFRSGALDKMNEEERKVFQTLNIKYIVDLRAKYENKRHPDPDFGIPVYRYDGPIIQGKGIDFSPIGMNQTGNAGDKQWQKLQEYYLQIPFQNPSFQYAMKIIREGCVPICVHCATGKDRTGILCMLLLLLLGVDENTIIQDYALSNEYRKAEIEQALQANQERIQESEVLKKLLLMKEGVIPSIGKSVLEEIKKRYGSYESYFESEYGFHEEDIAEMRKMYLE